MIVPFSIMFHCDFNVPRGSDALRAIVFRAICFLPYISVDVLSPNVISSFDGVILPGVRVGLSSGAFSESSLSEGMLFPDFASFFASSLYWMFNSGSESCSMSHMVAGDKTGSLSSLRSEANFFMFLYDKLCLVGFVTMFDSAVFGFLPQCASNDVIFVILFGMSLMF